MAALFVVVALLVAVVNRHGGTGPVLGMSVYGAVAITYLAGKLLASSWYRPYDGRRPAGLVVAAVVPVFNEDAEAFERCIGSLQGQTPPLDEIWVIDDGSSSTSCVEVAHRLLDGVDGARVLRLEVNRGKRHAQAHAFMGSTADVFVTLDSDTLLAPDAVAEGLRPFADAAITAVCGNARALNRRANLLTRLIDVRYLAAFIYERAAYDRIDSVLCASGVFSLWRGEVIRANLDDYRRQSFLGIEVGYGDDRRLSYYATLAGRVAFQQSAHAETLVPERLGQLTRQQVRWNKSFFRETLVLLRGLSPRRPAWWLALLELLTWLGFTTMLLLTLLVSPVLTGQLALVYYAVMAVLMAYARSARAATEPDGLVGFLLAPLYAVLHVVVFTPLRLYALVRLRDPSWGTRQSGVEVELVPVVAAASTQPGGQRCA